jgi:hypothetical protein
MGVLCVSSAHPEQSDAFEEKKAKEGNKEREERNRASFK